MLQREESAEQTQEERAMSQPSHSLATTGRASASDTSLHGARLLMARSIWGLAVLIDLGVLIVGLPAYAAQLNTFCADPTRVSCSYPQLDPAQEAALRQIGISLSGYAIYVLVLDVLITLLFIVVGALIFWHKSREPMGLFVSLLLITFGCLGTDQVHISPLNSGLVFLALPLVILQWPALGFLFYTFPDGRFVPRRSWLLAFLFVLQFGFYILPYPYNYDQWPSLAQLLESLLVYGSAVGTLVYRYIAVASPTQRQQIKWLAFGFAWTVLVLGSVYSLLPLLFPSLNDPGSLYQLTAPISTAIGYVTIPLGIGVALLRYRLWDIDVIINKTLVYGSLTALLATLYAGLIIGLTSLAGAFSDQASQPVILVVSTLAIAALVQPVRKRLQNVIDRRFYRKKYDAATTLAAFSATLRQEVDLTDLREHLLAVVQETMQPTHASLWLRLPEQPAAGQMSLKEIDAL
jgi:hypothetical protein